MDLGSGQRIPELRLHRTQLRPFWSDYHGGFSHHPLDSVTGGAARLVDAFQGGFLRGDEFEERTGTLAERIRGLESDHQALKQEQQKTLAGRELLGRLQQFTTTVADTLDTLSFEQRQKLARSLVEEVVLDDSDAHIYFKIPLPKPPFHPSGKGPASRVSRGLGLRSAPDENVSMRMPL